MNVTLIPSKHTLKEIVIFLVVLGEEHLDAHLNT